jgi:hypothetical protein
MATDLPEKAPRRKLRRDLAFIVGVSVMMLLVIVTSLSVAGVLGAIDSHDANSRNVETIAELQSRLDQDAEVTECVRLLDARLDDAVNDWLVAGGEVLGGLLAGQDAIRKRFGGITTDLGSAIAAKKAFAAEPVLPCPD